MQDTVGNLVSHLHSAYCTQRSGALHDGPQHAQAGGGRSMAPIG